MSDGPLRSLSMRPAWKKLAECADKAAFSSEEVRDALPAALAEDWRKEIPDTIVRKVREILSDSQIDFFCDQRTKELELLRGEEPGCPLRGLFLDYAIQVTAEGHSGDKALEEAASRAIADRAARGARQIEEHYHRKATQGRAVDVRQRIENGIRGSDMAITACSLVGIDKGEQPQRPAKQTGLNDGVQL